MSEDERSIALRIRQNLGGEVAIFLSYLGAGIRGEDRKRESIDKNVISFLFIHKA
jgi:hypothetical protein